MVTKAQPQHTDETTAQDQVKEQLVRTLEKFPGWDAKRRRWVHTDSGQEALALVNEVARKRRAKKEETDSSLRSE